MKKNWLIIIVVIVILLIAGLAAIGLTLNEARDSAEQQFKEENPIFHTVPEGGICREGLGDCQAGLTCMEGYCARP